jgi:hypothetical protein
MQAKHGSHGHRQGDITEAEGPGPKKALTKPINEVKEEKGNDRAEGGGNDVVVG